jgi:hypothetical protein
MGGLTMKRIAMVTTLTAFALAVGIGQAMAWPRLPPLQALTDDPVVVTVPQDGCAGNNCAVPEPTLQQLAAPCGNANCAVLRWRGPARPTTVRPTILLL